jgi:hypothetical protein
MIYDKQIKKILKRRMSAFLFWSERERTIFFSERERTIFFSERVQEYESPTKLFVYPNDTKS